MEYFKFKSKFPKSFIQILHQLLFQLCLFYAENHYNIHNCFVIDKTFTFFYPRENNVIYYVISFFFFCNVNTRIQCLIVFRELKIIIISRSESIRNRVFY